MEQHPPNAFVWLKQCLGDNADKFQSVHFIWATEKDMLEGEEERAREGKGARTLLAGIDIKFQVSRGRCENKENIL